MHSVPSGSSERVAETPDKPQSSMGLTDSDRQPFASACNVGISASLAFMRRRCADMRFLAMNARRTRQKHATIFNAAYRRVRSQANSVAPHAQFRSCPRTPSRYRGRWRAAEVEPVGVVYLSPTREFFRSLEQFARPRDGDPRAFTALGPAAMLEYMTRRFAPRVFAMRSNHYRLVRRPGRHLQHSHSISPAAILRRR